MTEDGKYLRHPSFTYSKGGKGMFSFNTSICLRDMMLYQAMARGIQYDGWKTENNKAKAMPYGLPV